MIHFHRDEDEELLVEAAARFAAERLAPDERTHEKLGYPQSLRTEYAELGFTELDEVSVQVCIRVWMALAEADPTAPLALIAQPQHGDGSLGMRAGGGARVPIPDLSESQRRVFAASLILGAARHAYAYARNYASERIVFGRPIAHHQGIAFQLVDCAVAIEAAECLLIQAAGEGSPVAIANAYLLAVEAGDMVTDRAVQFLGGHGYLFDHPVEKRMRDVRALALLWGGTTAAREVVSDGLLDLPPAIEVPA